MAGQNTGQSPNSPESPPSNSPESPQSNSPESPQSTGDTLEEKKKCGYLDVKCLFGIDKSLKEYIDDINSAKFGHLLKMPKETILNEKFKIHCKDKMIYENNNNNTVDEKTKKKVVML